MMLRISPATDAKLKEVAAKAATTEATVIANWTARLLLAVERVEVIFTPSNGKRRSVSVPVSSVDASGVRSLALPKPEAIATALKFKSNELAVRTLRESLLKLADTLAEVSAPWKHSHDGSLVVVVRPVFRPEYAAAVEADAVADYFRPEVSVDAPRKRRRLLDVRATRAALALERSGAVIALGSPEDSALEAFRDAKAGIWQANREGRPAYAPAVSAVAAVEAVEFIAPVIPATFRAAKSVEAVVDASVVAVAAKALEASVDAPVVAAVVRPALLSVHALGTASIVTEADVDAAALREELEALMDADAVAVVVPAVEVRTPATYCRPDAAAVSLLAPLPVEAVEVRKPSLLSGLLDAVVGAFRSAKEAPAVVVPEAVVAVAAKAVEAVAVSVVVVPVEADAVAGPATIPAAFRPAVVDAVEAVVGVVATEASVDAVAAVPSPLLSVVDAVAAKALEADAVAGPSVEAPAVVRAAFRAKEASVDAPAVVVPAVAAYVAAKALAVAPEAVVESVPAAFRTVAAGSRCGVRPAVAVAAVEADAVAAVVPAVVRAAFRAKEASVDAAVAVVTAPAEAVGVASTPAPSKAVEAPVGGRTTAAKADAVEYVVEVELEAILAAEADAVAKEASVETVVEADEDVVDAPTVKAVELVAAHVGAQAHNNVLNKNLDDEKFHGKASTVLTVSESMRTLSGVVIELTKRYNAAQKQATNLTPANEVEPGCADRLAAATYAKQGLAFHLNNAEEVGVEVDAAVVAKFVESVVDGVRPNMDRILEAMDAKNAATEVGDVAKVEALTAAIKGWMVDADGPAPIREAFPAPSFITDEQLVELFREDEEAEAVVESNDWEAIESNAMKNFKALQEAAKAEADAVAAPSKEAERDAERKARWANVAANEAMIASGMTLRERIAARKAEEAVVEPVAAPEATVEAEAYGYPKLTHEEAEEERRDRLEFRNARYMERTAKESAKANRAARAAAVVMKAEADAVVTTDGPARKSTRRTVSDDATKVSAERKRATVEDIEIKAAPAGAAKTVDALTMELEAAKARKASAHRTILDISLAGVPRARRDAATLERGDNAAKEHKDASADIKRLTAAIDAAKVEAPAVVEAPVEESVDCFRMSVLMEEAVKADPTLEGYNAAVRKYSKELTGFATGDDVDALRIATRRAVEALEEANAAKLTPVTRLAGAVVEIVVDGKKRRAVVELPDGNNFGYTARQDFIEVEAIKKLRVKGNYKHRDAVMDAIANATQKRGGVFKTYRADWDGLELSAVSVTYTEATKWDTDAEALVEATKARRTKEAAAVLSDDFAADFVIKDRLDYEQFKGIELTPDFGRTVQNAKGYNLTFVTDSGARVTEYLNEERHVAGALDRLGLGCNGWDSIRHDLDSLSVYGLSTAIEKAEATGQKIILTRYTGTGWALVVDPIPGDLELEFSEVVDNSAAMVLGDGWL